MNKDERNPFRRAKSSVPWYGRGSASTFPPPRCPKPQEFAANREGEVEDDLGAPAEPFSAWFWLGRSLALPPKSSFPAAPSIEFLEPRILLHAHPTPIPSIDTNTALLSGQHVLTAAQIPGPVEAAHDDDRRAIEFARLNPLGGMMFISEENTGLIPSADDVHDFEVFIEANQTIAAVAEPRDPNATLSIQLIEVDHEGTSYVALGPGQAVVLPPTSIEADGTYTVRVGGDDTSGFELKLIRNASIEALLGDSDEENKLPINDSFIPVGLGRFGVVGSSDPQILSIDAVVWGVQPETGQIVKIDPETGEVEQSFAAPDTLLADHRRIGLSIADAGESLIYINSDHDPDTLYRLDPDTGSTLSSETTFDNDVIEGLAFDSTGGPFTIFSEDFDGPTHTFSFNNRIGGGTGMWHLSTGRQLDGQPNHSPPRNIYFGDFEDDVIGGDYMNLNLSGTRGEATSPVVSLPSSGIITLRFNHLVETEPVEVGGEDATEVQIDAGAGFVTVLSNQDGSLTRDSNGVWQTATADLTPFAGQDITIRFWFNAPDLFFNHYEGWFVDDIRVTHESDQTAFVYHADEATGVTRQEGYSGTTFTHINGDTLGIFPVGGLGGDDTGRLFGFFDDDLIHEIDPFTADSLLAQFAPRATDVEGLAFDGASLYMSTASGDLYRMNPNDGSVFSVVSVPDGALYGLAALGGSVTTVPDIDAYRVDLTGKIGEPIDIVLAGQGHADFSAQTLELLDVDGETILATAASNPLGVDAMNYDLAILDFIVPDDGIYTLRVTSTAGGEYGIIVTDPITFDTEPNDNIDEPLRSLDGTGMALGLLGGDFDDAFIFFEDFTGGLEAFVIDNEFGSGNGLWHLSKGRQSDGDTEHSPPNNLYYGKDEDDLGNGDYNTGRANGGAVVSPLVTLPPTGPITLSFNHLLETEGRTISDIVEVSVNDGIDVTTILSSTDGSLPTGTGDEWRIVQADLTEFAGSDIRLRFTFDSLDHVSNTFEGWYIDDVAIVEGDPIPEDPVAFNVRKLSQVRLSDIPGGNGAANDIWGYVSPAGREYALLGVHRGSAYIDVTTPTNPVVVAFIPGPDESGGGIFSSSLCHDECEGASEWRDLKFYEQYAYITNETGGGLQIVDLTEIDDGTVSEVRSVTLDGLRTAHNIAINPDSGFAYVTGANIANGGLVVFDLAADPTNPQIVGTWDDRYIHDVEVISYKDGPFAGREIAYGFAESSGVRVIDVTDKSNMFTVANRPYPNVTYAHYGAISEDQKYLFVNDELDELQDPNVSTTTTYVFDIEDPADPQYLTSFTNGLPSIDHNLRVRGNFLFEANYRSGLRIYDVSDVLNAREVGYYDTYPDDDGRHFNGAWGVYAGLPSGVVLVSDIEGGLFVLNASQATSLGGASADQGKADGSSDPSEGDVFVAHHPVSHTHDLYTLNLSADQPVTITTRTLFDDPATTPRNELDPSLTIFDPAGSPIAADDNSLDGKNALVEFTASVAGRYTIQVVAEDGTGEYILNVETAATAQVVGRHVFYNNSARDGNDVSASANDDMAIAPSPDDATASNLGKTALLPGNTATFENYTSYSRGINGIMVDVMNLADPEKLGLSDFEFRVGNDQAPADWGTAPDPDQIAVRRGAGLEGSDRITIIWDDYDEDLSTGMRTRGIGKQWLQVNVLANERTGLQSRDVHYWGNAIGETGDSSANAIVNATDELAARFDQHSFIDPAPIDDYADFDRDGRVNATDELIARFNNTSVLTALQLITALVEGSAARAQSSPVLRIEQDPDSVSLLALAEPIGGTKAPSIDVNAAPRSEAWLTYRKLSALRSDLMWRDRVNQVTRPIGLDEMILSPVSIFDMIMRRM